MTKKARIAELERRIEQLETELANLRGKPMLVYGRASYPLQTMPDQSLIALASLVWLIRDKQ